MYLATIFTILCLLGLTPEVRGDEVISPNIPQGPTTSLWEVGTGFDVVHVSSPIPLVQINIISTLRQLNVFQPDDREPVTLLDTLEYPFSTVGMLIRGGRYCTATLVYKNIILTNRHCTLTDGQGNITQGFIDEAVFYLSYRKTNWSARWSNSSKFTAESAVSTESDQDWALLVLETPIGESTGWMGSKKRDKGYFSVDRKVNMISYSYDLFEEFGTAGYQKGCSTRGFRRSYKLHDCDDMSGSSGSAMFEGWEDPYVVGVNYAEFRNGGTQSSTQPAYSRDYANVFDGSSSYFDQLQRMIGVSPTPTPGPTKSPTLTPARHKSCSNICKGIGSKRRCRKKSRGTCKCRWRRVRRRMRCRKRN
jgi:V8-like Glu-specific endopeptidase